MQSSIEADEAKKIVESITDSITGGEKQERKCDFISFELMSISVDNQSLKNHHILQLKKAQRRSSVEQPQQSAAFVTPNLTLDSILMYILRELSTRTTTGML